MLYTLRDADKRESRERSALGGASQAKAARAVGAAAVGAAAAVAARVANGRLEVPPNAVGQLYVFVSEGSRFRRVAGMSPMALLAGGPRSFALPAGITGTLFVLIAPQLDAELDRLAEPHEGALPVRNWTRIAIR